MGLCTIDQMPVNTMSAMALLFLEMTFPMGTIVHTHPKTAACPSFDIIYPSTRTVLCPGDIITYTCAFSSSFNTITTWWTGSGFQCPSLAMSPINTIALSQPAGASLNAVPVSCGDLSAVMTNISGTCYTSVLTITWTSVPTATSYNIRIKGPAFGTGYSVLSIGAPQYMYSFTGLTNNTVYTVSVEAVSCAGSSSPAIGIIKSHVH